MSDTNWIDRNDYPFRSRFLELEAGRLHYVDEGQGRPLVMVHGTGTWSYLFRDLIKGLAPRFRCIAVDHLGFGLSDKPQEAAGCPQDHARHLKQLITALELRDVVMIGHDFGGPIGLSYAVQHPENIRQLILSNTWMWSLHGDPHFEKAHRQLGGALGRLLYQHGSFAGQVLRLRESGSTVSARALRHYQGALPSPATRRAAWSMARARIDASDWLSELMRQQDQVRNMPALVLWGGRDQRLPRKLLQNWSLLLTNATLHSVSDAGHFIFEDQGPALLPVIEAFLNQTPGPGTA